MRYLILILSMVLIGCGKSGCHKKAVILEVGKCDQGYCGVKYKDYDGYIGFEELDFIPMEGREVYLTNFWGVTKVIPRGHEPECDLGYRNDSDVIQSPWEGEQ